MLSGSRVVVTGGTGSLGQVLVRRLLSGEMGRVQDVLVYSRDEAKQHAMRLAFQHRTAATDDVLYERDATPLRFKIGDVNDASTLLSALRDADVVVHAAALKQVPTCEYAPFEAVKTNILGAETLVRVIREHRLPISVVVGVTTDKACKPVNVMGMTKALQERILAHANLESPKTRFVVARYGNVLASRGSVIPLFHHQIRRGGPVTVTAPEMTRFLLSLDHAADTVFAAIAGARPGETYIPRAASARIVDVAAALIGDRPIAPVFTGIRPGEKVHETLVSEEEAPRTEVRGDYLAIGPILPELRSPRHCGEPLESSGYSSAEAPVDTDGVLEFLRDEAFTTAGEYSSAEGIISADAVAQLLREHHLMLEDQPQFLA